MFLQAIKVLKITHFIIVIDIRTSGKENLFQRAANEVELLRLVIPNATNTVETRTSTSISTPLPTAQTPSLPLPPPPTLVTPHMSLVADIANLPPPPQDLPLLIPPPTLYTPPLTYSNPPKP